MDARIERMERVGDAEARAMFGWLSDPDNRFYSTVCPGPDAGLPHPDWQSYQAALNASPAQRYALWVGGEFVGEVAFVLDHRLLLRTEPRSAWLALGIGDARFRGRGLGRQAVAHAEREVLRAGAHRIELAVFDYNTPALSFWRGLGYREFQHLERVTWWEGAWWGERRLEKALARRT